MTQILSSKKNSEVHSLKYQIAAKFRPIFQGVLGVLAISVGTSEGQVSGQAPVITSAVSANAKVGVAFTQQITASNNPTKFSATGLPSGLTLNARTGFISGTPTAIDGSYNVTLAATNAGGTGNKAFGLTVAPTLPVITSAVSATGSVGSAFSYKIAASNFARTYAATGLPSGLSVNATSGVISGVPATAGNATVVLSASNGAGNATKSLALTIKPLPPVISASSASAKVGTPFVYQITASNSPTKYRATGLPNGLTDDMMTGVITGTPICIDGIYNVTIAATNSGGTGNNTLTITVAPTLPVITSEASATGAVGSAFSYKIAASNFARTYAAIGLPSGLSMNATSGVISGVPVTVGNSTVVLSASNGAGNATKTISLTIKPLPPVISSADSASASLRVPFLYQISASNTPTHYAATGLPAGLTLNATSGLISGVPVAARNSTVNIYAYNAGGSAKKSITLKVALTPLAISDCTLPSGDRALPYAGHTFTASGGAGGNSWSVIDGFLPLGMTLNATTGKLDGTPKIAGSYTFVLRVEDSSRSRDEVEVVLDILNSNKGATMTDVFSVMPGGGANQTAGNVTCSFEYKASGSTWNAGVSEEKVFFASMNSSSGWRLGIGKGGQVYSLRGSFGEAIPPQRADAPWVDEAWQFVATNLELVGPVQSFQAEGGVQRSLGFPIQFFIHQSGIYMGSLAGNSLTGSASAPFYSPMLKKRWDPATRTLSVVSWSQMARSPNVWKSGMLTYATYRDLGDGGIEVTNFVTNFGDQDLTFINTPWGGARHSSFPETILSQPEGGWIKGSTAAYGVPAPIPLHKTGGWQGWTRNSTQEGADALALVFGKDPLTGGLPNWRAGRGVLTYGAGGDSVRDYDVASIHATIRLQAGQSLACRWHLVVGPFGQTRIKASNLTSYAGLWMPGTDAAAFTPVWTTGGTPASSGTGSPDLYLYAQPIPGTVPVFVMEDTRTGRKFATTDPYELCPTAPYPNPLPTTHPQYALYQNRVVHYQYSSPGAVRELLGYASCEARATGGDVEVSLPGVGSTPLKLWVPAQ